MSRKDFVEGIHYSIHKRERKKLIKNPRKPMCSTCEQCNHKNLCLNRRNKETMDRCSKCRNCRNAEVCDKFKIYEEYEGNLLKLGKNANTGKNIRQSFGGKSKEEVFEKLEKQYIKNQEEGIKETVYQPNEKSIITIAEELEEKKYKNSDTKAPGYIRNMQSIKACSAYNFTLKPIQNVTKTEIERFLESERVKANSTLDKEYRIIKKAFKRICKNAGLKVITVKHKKNSKTKGIHFVNEKTSSVNVHMLRHTFSTRCIEAGVPMEVLQKILGHANIQTTINIYGDIFDYYQRHHINNYSEYMAKVNEKYNKEFSNINDENAGISSKNDIEQLNKNSIEKGLEIGL